MININVIKSIWFKYQLSDFDVSAQLIYVKQLDYYIGSDVGILQCLEYVKESFSELYGDKCVECKVTDILLEAAEAGDFDAALRKYFHPNIAIAFELMRCSNEKNIISEIGKLIKLEKELVTTTFFKLLSPILFALLGVAALSVMGYMVIPGMIENYPADKELPFEVAITLATSDIVISNWYFFLLIPLLLYGWLKWALPNLVPNTALKIVLRTFVDGKWPISLYKSIWTLRLLKLYGLLKKSDIADVDIIEIIKLFSPPFIQFFLNKMSVGFEEGAEKHEYFMRGLLSKSQELKLRPFMSHCPDSLFSEQLLDASEKGKEELEIQYSKTSSKVSLFLYITGIVLALVAIGSVVEATLLR